MKPINSLLFINLQGSKWGKLYSTDRILWLILLNRIPGLRLIYAFLFSVTLFHSPNNWKSLNLEINNEKKKFGPPKYALEKKFGATNYSRGHDGTMALNPRTHYGTWLTKFSRLQFNFFGYNYLVNFYRKID